MASDNSTGADSRLPGRHWSTIVSWDGRLEDLHRLPNGVWLLRVRIDDFQPPVDDTYPVSLEDALAWLLKYAPGDVGEFSQAPAAVPPPACVPEGAPRYFTAEQAAAHLGLPSVKALYNLVSRVCQGNRRRRKYRFTAEDVAKLARHEDPWPEAPRATRAKKGGGR